MISRRGFLRTSSGFLLALPFLSSLERRASGGPPTANKRLVIFNTPNGQVMDAWRSTSTSSLVFPQNGVLSALAGNVSDLVQIDGLDVGDGKTPPHYSIRQVLTGAQISYQSLMPSGPSLDHALGQELGAGTKFTSLQLGVLSDPAAYYRGLISFASGGAANPAEISPLKLWWRVFGDVVSGDANAAAKLIAERKSVLDDALVDFDKLGKVVSSADRQRLEAHAQGIRSLETQLASSITFGGACSKPAMPPDVEQTRTNFQQLAKLQMDLLVMALTCNTTRFATLQFTDPQSQLVFDWLPGVTGPHHTLSHIVNQPSATAQLLSINQFYASQFAYLINAMKAVPEGSSTLLDNSIVMWCNEISDGALHSTRGVPILLAGSGGGAIKTGRYLAASGQHNQLLVSLANAMGSSMTSFGDPMFGSGPLPGFAG